MGDVEQTGDATASNGDDTKTEQGWVTEIQRLNERLVDVTKQIGKLREEKRSAAPSDPKDATSNGKQPTTDAPSLGQTDLIAALQLGELKSGLTPDAQGYVNDLMEAGKPLKEIREIAGAIAKYSAPARGDDPSGKPTVKGHGGRPAPSTAPTVSTLAEYAALMKSDPAKAAEVLRTTDLATLDQI